METDNTERKRYGSKRWLFFALGIITGIILTALANYLLKDTCCHKDKPIIPIFLHTPTVVDDTANDDTPDKKQTPVSPKTDTTSSIANIAQTTDTTNIETIEPDIEDVEFSITPPENDDVVVIDMVILERKIKAVNKSIPDSTGAVTPMTIAVFEVQQWNTPIKNSVSYLRNNHQLKIKGLDISDIEIIFFNNEYYLIKGKTSYVLKNNTHYERLPIKLIPNLQDL